MKTVTWLLVIILTLSFHQVEAQNSQSTKLRLELISTHPTPVIDSTHPDTKDIKGGFETGNSMKLTINGETAYHMIVATMETTKNTQWNYPRTEHWVSTDGFDWKRAKVIFYSHHDPETGLWRQTSSPFPYFDTIQDRWFVYHNSLALDSIRYWAPPCLLRRAGAKTKGLEGIYGEFDFPGEIVAPSGYAHPTNAFSSSISTPFQSADGRWYAFLGGGPEPLNSISGKWWICQVSAPGPEGPFKYIPELAPVLFMEPTGYVENPLPMKLLGPETGKEYWAIMFDFLKPEVTTGKNTDIGFSFSTDGVNWPVENAQIIDIRSGLPQGETPWWYTIRTPHQLIDEGDGTYTCYFTAYDESKVFESVGMVKFRLIEEISDCP
jgi:hypothetical protein